MWRADLLEAVDGPPGSLNRAHHHPAFNGWEPASGSSSGACRSEPVQWVGEQLSDLGALLDRAGVTDDGSFAADAESLRGAAGRDHGGRADLLDQVKAGELAAAPAGDQPESARVSWL